MGQSGLASFPIFTAHVGPAPGMLKKARTLTSTAAENQMLLQREAIQREDESDLRKDPNRRSPNAVSTLEVLRHKMARVSASVLQQNKARERSLRAATTKALMLSEGNYAPG